MKNTPLIVALLIAFPFYLQAGDVPTSAPAVSAASSPQAPENAFTQAPDADRPEGSLVGASAIVSGGALTITGTTNGTPTVWNQIFLGTEENPGSGYTHGSGREGGRGMSYLIEGGSLYRWAGLGDRTEWKWEKITSATVTQESSPESFTVEVPIEDLHLKAGTSLRIFVSISNENYQACLDTLPRGDEVWHVKVPAAEPGQADHPSAVSRPSADTRERFKKITSYACYYGKGAVEQLSKQGAAIIETKTQTPRNIAAVKKAGTVVVGYISVGEDSELRKGDGQGPGGYDSRYFDKDHDNIPDKNGTWNSYYANAATKSWTDDVLKTAQQMEDRYGVDGYFLDTVETVSLYQQSRDGMINLIRKLREAHPNSVIVLNRGFDVIADTGDIVDGFMYEVLTLGYDMATKNYYKMRVSSLDYSRRQMETLLRPLQKANGLVVMALDYAAGPDDPNVHVAYDRAVTLGAIPCVTNVYLGAIYDVPYQGHFDAKWTKDLETAESRTYVLPASQNGFPEGTAITPSSNYPDYSVSPIVDGLKDKSAIGWMNRAWASLDTPQDHRLEFRFPKAITPHRLVIDWNTEQGKSYISRKIRVETSSGKDAADWQPAWSTDSNSTLQTVVELGSTPIRALRIEQPSGSGSEDRPNVMWVQQVRVE